MFLKIKDNIKPINKKIIYLFLSALLANGIFIIALPSIMRNGLLPYLKISIFSETTGRLKEEQLNKKIASKFINGKDYHQALTRAQKDTFVKIDSKILEPNCEYLSKKGNLYQATSTDCKVYGILTEFMPGKGGTLCGNKGDIRSRISYVENNIGCCSDFSETFLVLAGYSNIKAREVHDGGHTTAEYFDPQSNKWKWIDTQYKQQIIKKGVILSANEIIESQFIDNLELFDPIDKNYISKYLSISNKNMIGYTLGNNILEVDKFEEKMKFIIPQKPLHQLLSHIVGKRPSYLWVRREPDDLPIIFFKKSLILYFISLGIINIITLYTLIRLVKLSILKRIS